MNEINLVRLRDELYSNRTRIEGETCLGYWRLEFGYCLFFVIWLLDFYLRYTLATRPVMADTIS
jgi:hypothetical protein